MWEMCARGRRGQKRKDFGVATLFSPYHVMKERRDHKRLGVLEPIHGVRQHKAWKRRQGQCRPQVGQSQDSGGGTTLGEGIQIVAQRLERVSQ
jgi:hypothetical protein